MLKDEREALKLIKAIRFWLIIKEVNRIEHKFLCIFKEAE